MRAREPILKKGGNDSCEAGNSQHVRDQPRAHCFSPLCPAILPRISKEGARLMPGEPGYEEMVARELQGQWKI